MHRGSSAHEVLPGTPDFPVLLAPPDPLGRPGPPDPKVCKEYKENRALPARLGPLDPPGPLGKTAQLGLPAPKVCREYKGNRDLLDSPDLLELPALPVRLDPPDPLGKTAQLGPLARCQTMCSLPLPTIRCSFLPIL